MALVAFPGQPIAFLGYNPFSNVAFTGTTLDAANEAVIWIGRIITSDGGSHTIDTSGSSSLQWRTSSITFANGSTTVKVGLAAVLGTAGPPGRAANAADVITFDVSKSLTGGGGGITGSAWQTHTPDTGTKTIANGDLVAFCIQMTARGGADAIIVQSVNGALGRHRPTLTNYTGGSYAQANSLPNALIVFSDGAYGWFAGGNVASDATSRTFNSGSVTKEYGQLFQMPFPMKVYGAYGWIDPDNDFDVILYSDPLGGSPAAERTCSFDANNTADALSRAWMDYFSSPYTVPANTPIGAVYKPGASNITAYYKTLANAAHRVTDPWGTSGYGISRASGAFANANSSLDHYYIGLLVGAFDSGVWPSGHLGV
jgi:hypothetical protein